MRTNLGEQLTEFSRAVISLIKTIPKGKVATYGLIATCVGNPRSARQVAWLLHSCTKTQQLPWHRVIKSGGQLAFPLHTEAYEHQKTLLEMEGIVIMNGCVDLKQYLWDFVH